MDLRPDQLFFEILVKFLLSVQLISGFFEAGEKGMSKFSTFQHAFTLCLASAMSSALLPCHEGERWRKASWIADSVVSSARTTTCVRHMVIETGTICMYISIYVTVYIYIDIY